MNFENFLPSIWKRSGLPLVRGEESPFYNFQQEMNRVFEDFFKGLDVAPIEAFGGGFGKFSPSLDVKEDDKEMIITAELPGLEEKDFEILLKDNNLTIKGEKREEKEDKDKDYYRLERSYGAFSRVIALPDGIDATKVDANFKNGVLKITLPRTAEAKNKVKKIAVKKD